MIQSPEPLLARQESRRPLTVRSVFTFRHRGLMGVLLFVPVGAAALFSPPTVAEDSLPGVLLNTAGWLAFLVYAAFRVWATLYVGGRKDRELQTMGPYSITRNPLYLGSFAFAVAVACFLKSIVFGATLLPALVLYLQFVVRAEEHFLEAKFQGVYRDYCRRTPRFWPRWAAFVTPPLVHAELTRLKQEVMRLSRAALLIIALNVLVYLRAGTSWPHWFSAP